jgi:putative hemolysin
MAGNSVYEKPFNPFKLDDLLFNSLPSIIKKPLVILTERLLALHPLALGYAQLPACDNSEQFSSHALQYLNVEPKIVTGTLDSIPKDGPVVVVANHPFGGIEGIILTSLLQRIRPDIRIMANSLLKRVPELSDIFIGVNPYGHARATLANIKPLREAVRWLNGGGVLVVFPAGDVSRLRPFSMTISDSRWDAGIARLIRMTSAKVVPIHISGRNSALFHMLGVIHPRLRSLMLPRELANKRDMTIELRVGEVISSKLIQSKGNDDDIAKYLRLHTYMLARPVKAPEKTVQSTEIRHQPIADPVAPGLLNAEVHALPDTQTLGESNGLKVIYAKAGQIPWLLQEIGRLREVTFRAVGEGTGKSSDIDLYDTYYLHLFIWNDATNEVVGAYRLGLADEILEKFGKKGLYTYSLFRYSRRFLKALNPAIELGRSFVRTEYQRSFAPLLMLWKGIGEFVLRHPRYAVLFGPVSISNDYSSVSQQLLIDFLRLNSYDNVLSRHIHPRKPYRKALRPVWGKSDLASMASIDEVSELVSLQEEDEKGVPILIKQYLKLGGRLLGFNVDKEFGDCIDGLIMVDLRQTEVTVLQRYMGKEGAKEFLAIHEYVLEERA